MYHSSEKPKEFNDNIIIDSDDICVSILKPTEVDDNSFLIRLFNTKANTSVAKISFKEKVKEFF